MTVSRAGPSAVHFAWTSEDEAGEEVMTIACLQETAEQAGIPGIAIAMEDIGWHHEHGRFVDLNGRGIAALCKLYPWRRPGSASVRRPD